MRYIFTLIIPVALIACAPPAQEVATPAQSAPEHASEAAVEVTPEADPEALRYVKDRLVGSYTGEWNLFGLDANDKTVPGQTFTDTVTAKNPRIEKNRAIVDVASSMDMGGDKPADLRRGEAAGLAEQLAAHAPGLHGNGQCDGRKCRQWKQAYHQGRHCHRWSGAP